MTHMSLHMTPFLLQLMMCFLQSLADDSKHGPNCFKDPSIYSAGWFLYLIDLMSLCCENQKIHWSGSWSCKSGIKWSLVLCGNNGRDEVSCMATIATEIIFQDILLFTCITRSLQVLYLFIYFKSRKMQY